MFIKDNSVNIFIGSKGSGKTTAAAAFARSFLRRKRLVFSNVDIAGTYSVDPRKLGLFYLPRGSIVIIDEAGIEFNNRDFKNFSQDLIKWIKLIRHQGCTLIFFSQALDMDISIRRMTDTIYHIRRLGRHFSFILGVKMWWSWTEASTTDGSSYVQNCKPRFVLNFFTNRLLFLPLYWKYFDTHYLPPLKTDWHDFCALRPDIEKKQRSNKNDFIEE